MQHGKPGEVIAALMNVTQRAIRQAHACGEKHAGDGERRHRLEHLLAKARVLLDGDKTELLAEKAKLADSHRGRVLLSTGQPPTRRATRHRSPTRCCARARARRWPPPSAAKPARVDSGWSQQKRRGPATVKFSAKRSNHRPCRGGRAVRRSSPKIGIPRTRPSPRRRLGQAARTGAPSERRSLAAARAPRAPVATGRPATLPPPAGGALPRAAAGSAHRIPAMAWPWPAWSAVATAESPVASHHRRGRAPPPSASPVASKAIS